MNFTFTEQELAEFVKHVNECISEKVGVFSNPHTEYNNIVPAIASAVGERIKSRVLVVKW
jgi:hypothetical protein